MFLFAVQATNDIYEKYHTERLEFQTKDIPHSPTQAGPVEGLEYIFDTLGYYPDGFQEPCAEPWTKGVLSQFDQAEFVPEGWTFEESTFKPAGFIYVPHDCVDEIGCNVHFAFHGCGGNAQSVANTWGYNEFASTNRIIMVYPDSACWGYSNTLTDDLMFTYDGMMPKAIVSMMERVTSSPSDLI